MTYMRTGLITHWKQSTHDSLITDIGFFLTIQENASQLVNHILSKSLAWAESGKNSNDDTFNINKDKSDKLWYVRCLSPFALHCFHGKASDTRLLIEVLN